MTYRDPSGLVVENEKEREELMIINPEGVSGGYYFAVELLGLRGSMVITNESVYFHNSKRGQYMRFDRYKFDKIIIGK